MRTDEQLKTLLLALDGKDYAGYQSLKGAWRFPGFELWIDRIPKDPYAPPGTGVYRARVPRLETGMPTTLCATRARKIALEDFLARRFLRQCGLHNPGRRGTGNSGVISICEPGQAILERTSVSLDDEAVEFRFSFGMPAEGRSIKADVAVEMLVEELPRIVAGATQAEDEGWAAAARHVETAEDAQILRACLAGRGLVAFVGDGAVLPRASGVNPTPLQSSELVAFTTPASLRVSFVLPNAGVVTGMGIPRGVTLIAGGGFHGKSTLLQGLEQGIYNHIPGDGRERCVILPGAVKVRAANGRAVTNVDISAFITGLPLGGSTTGFSTENASGSTSQAASICEAVEAGAEVLLMDEDTSATNFMFRDRRMQELVAAEHEPITTLVDRVRELYEDRGVSTILVMGGSGDYFNVADCVIQMTRFQPSEVTARARELAQKFDTGRLREGGGSFPPPRRRFPLGEGLSPHNEYGRVRVNASEPGRLIFGQTTVELGDVEQLAETAQTRAIARAILHAKPSMDGVTGLSALMEQVVREVEEKGLEVLDPERVGDLAQFRGLEFAAAINRLRGLPMEQAS